MDLSEAAAAWRRDGFVVIPGYLAGSGLAAAQRDLAVVYPTAEEYHAAPGEGRNRAYTGDEYGGIIPFPFPTVALSRLVVHDKLVALAEATSMPTTTGPAAIRGETVPSTPTGTRSPSRPPSASSSSSASRRPATPTGPR